MKIVAITGNYTEEEIERHKKEIQPLISFISEQANLPADAEHVIYCNSMGSNFLVESEKIFSDISEDDYVIIGSLLDISPSIPDSLKLLERLYQKQCEIYIYSINPVRHFGHYRSSFYKIFGFQPYDALHKRPTVYDIKLLECAARLREKKPQVAYRDITMATGIPQSAIHAYLKRTRSVMPKRRASRRITSEEIEEINAILREIVQ